MKDWGFTILDTIKWVYTKNGNIMVDGSGYVFLQSEKKCIVGQKKTKKNDFFPYEKHFSNDVIYEDLLPGQKLP